MANATNKLPEGMRHDWNIKSWKANDIKDRLPDVLNQIQTLYDKAGSADIGNLTFDSFLQPILQAQRLTFGHFWWHGTAGTPITFPRLVAVEKEVRDAATAAGKAIDDLTLEMFMRKDIFERMVEYRKTCELDPEYVRFVDRMIVVGKGNGLELNEQHRNKVKLLKLEINNLVGEFDNRLIEDKTSVLFNESELAGLSEDFIKNLETDPQTGLKKLTMRYPTYLPVMRQCRIPDTRKKMSLAYTNRGGKRNEEIMQRVVQLRHECANLLGYENWATYRQEAYVAKDPKTVNSFLATLAAQLQPLWKEEKEALLKLKAEECQKYGYEFNGDLDMWDLIYYCNLMEETEYSIDTEKLREYFPLDTVTTGLLGVYAHILGLEFTKLVDPPAWHDDVFAYKVNDRQSGELMGYVYMDLFPREGKFTHYANKPMQSGAVNEAGVKEKTITCMVCNFSPPSQGKPSLLTPSEVETYFHEFGHAMHAICSKAKVHMFWGTHVERDFVEAPSQMLENWVKERVILDRMSGHYQTGETMPNDEVDKMKKSDKASAGYSNLRQIVLATFDQRIHQNGSLNPRKVYSETMFEILGLAPHPDSFFPGVFSHVMNSYDAGYYSYMWSEMYSADMYETVFEKVGPLNTNAGMQYRQKILEKGGSVDALDMLRDFLGREPNDKAFMKHKGLTAEN